MASDIDTKTQDRAVKLIDSLYSEYDPKCDKYREQAKKNWNGGNN